MLKFKCVKEIESIIQDAEEKGFMVDTTGYDAGGDVIWLRDMTKRLVQIRFNTVSGCFFAYRPFDSKNAWATETSYHLDDDPLYQEILNLLYEPLKNNL